MNSEIVIKKKICIKKKSNKNIKINNDILNDKLISKLKQNKKEHEELINTKFMSLEKQIADLKDLLSIEISNQNNKFHAIEKWTANELDILPSKIIKILEPKINKNTIEIKNQLNEIHEIKKYVKDELNMMKNDIQLNYDELKQDIKANKIMFENKADIKEERYDRLELKIEKEKIKLIDKIKNNKVIVDNKLLEIRQSIDIEKEFRQKSEKLIHQTIQDHVDDIKLQIEQEINDRKQENDELIEAINHFTVASAEGFAALADDNQEENDQEQNQDKNDDEQKQK